VRALQALLLLACGVIGGCGGGPPIPAEDLLLRITLGHEEVGLGRAFPITVLRVWSKELLPGAWNDRTLAPLALRLERIERREDDSRIEERRHYVGYAFSLADLSIAAPKFVARPKAGGPDRITAATPLSLRVRPELDPLAPGPPDLPDLPAEQRSRRWLWTLLLLLLTLAALVLVRRARRPAATAPAQDPGMVAVARLRALHGEAPGVAVYLELANLLRAYLSARFGLPADEMTTEEIAAGGAGRARFAEVLARCDLVKFAGQRPDADALPPLLDRAEASVREGASA